MPTQLHVHVVTSSCYNEAVICCSGPMTEWLLSHVLAGEPSCRSFTAIERSVLPPRNQVSAVVTTIVATPHAQSPYLDLQDHWHISIEE